MAEEKTDLEKALEAGTYNEFGDGPADVDEVKSNEEDGANLGDD